MKEYIEREALYSEIVPHYKSANAFGSSRNVCKTWGKVLDMVKNAPAADPTSELKHYLEAEIQITVERQKDELSPMYDGVLVGRAEAVQLRNRHIKFCKYLLYLCEKGDNHATDVH